MFKPLPKQNLKIKTFLGINQNAVLSQIWVAMCYFLLTASQQRLDRFKINEFQYALF